MIHLPIEQRYDKRNQVFHSSAFAIAAGVVSVGAAAGSAAISMSAADKAAKAQGAAGKKYQEQLSKATGLYESRLTEATGGYEQRLKKATKSLQRQQNQLRQQVQEINPNLNIPQYDLRNATLEGIEAANRVTANTLQQIESIAPGSAQARQQVGQIINNYLAGQVPQDVQEQTTRMIAERGGAGFNIATAGRGMMVPSAPQANLARSLGLTSLELQQQGANLAGSWQSIAGQFVARPEQFMQLGLQGRAQNIDVAQANIRNRMAQLGMIGDINIGLFGAQRGVAQDIYGAQTGMAQNIYGAQTGQAQQGYGVAQQGIASTLASRQAVAQGVQGIGSAAAGALSGIGSAYGQLATAQGASTTPLSSGFYGGELGAAKAYNVAPSQLSYQKPTGGFLGIGGQGGGYYYTPSGVYGR